MIFDLHGREVAGAAREVAVRYPQPLWAEVDPETWWQATTYVVREALEAGAVAPERIAGIGISGLMHAPVLLDASGAAVAPAMLWMDQRCASHCDALRREAEALGVRGARGFSTTHTAPKLRWLAETRPELLARTHQLLLPKDFIRFRLTGIGGTDAADAGGTGMYDRAAGDWAWEIVRLAGADPRIMPVIRPAWARAGGVTPQAAAETGLAPGTPVAVGGADTFCTRLGAGPLAPGEVCIYLGTAAWIAMPSAGETLGAGGDGQAGGATVRPPAGPAGAAARRGRPHPAGGHGPAGRTAEAREAPGDGEGTPERARGPEGAALAVRGFGATSTTGAALRWARDLLAPQVARLVAATPLSGAWSYDALAREAAEVEPGAEGLYFLPHLMGERGPQADPLARGALVGLTLRHGRPQVVRAVLEGTVFQIRRLLEARLGGAPPAGGLVCGGGARSALWLQILADVTRLPLRAPAVVEAGALGAAILGGAAAGVLSMETAQAQMVRTGARYVPDPERAARYETLYTRYCRLDDLLAPWFRE
jgi:xylulokinase